MPPHVFRYKPVQGRLAPIITIGIKLGEVWYPIGVYVDSGAAYTLLHAAVTRGAGFDYRTGHLIPPYLTEKLLASRAALEGERKQVTVLFADLKGSTELIAGLDPEAARTLLDPTLHHMIEAVHHYAGTVNQVLGDGIVALFGPPLAHEDYAVRACYAALAMQTALQRYAEEVRRTQGLLVQMRAGLNSGEVVVRAIGNDLHMDYSAVGQTTHMAARMEQLATPGHCSRDSECDMDRPDERFYTTGPNLFPQESQGCSDRV